MLLTHCLLSQFFGDLSRLRFRLRTINDCLERMPLLLGVKLLQTDRRVVRAQTFDNPPIARARNVT